MPKMFRAGIKFWVFFGLLSVTFRVFTGAPEAQVNFTSLLVDQKIHSVIYSEKVLHQGKFFDSADADSIPEKHRTYATYKKYVTPDNYFAVLPHDFQKPLAQQVTFGATGLKVGYEQSFAPHSHSPPAVVSAPTPTHTTTTDSSVVLEKKFEEFTINNSTWGISRLKL